MGWLTNLFNGGIGSLINSIGDAASKFITTDKDKQAFMLETEKLLQKRDSEIEQTIRAELTAKTRVLEAELNQGDAYTKRARPTVVYFGLVVIFINHVLVPNLVQIINQFAEASITYQTVNLPDEFWMAWGGICSVWVIGRSAEKRGSRNRLTDAVTGNPSKSLLD